MWLIIWWGSCNHQASFSFLFWDCVVEPFPLAATGSFLRDGTKMQHALPVCCMFSPWHNFYQNEATLFERRARGEEVGLGVAERECCIFFLGCWGSGLGLASRKRWRASPSFPIGSSNEDECLGFFFFSPPCGKFSGKYNWYLPPKLFQSVTKYLCGYFVQGTKCLYLIKSLQNCLITVLNVRHLCNLNVRYKFNFWVSSIIFLLKKENNFQIELE